ncbi:hypothetical protein OsI_11728 [Oryza sativa Indica Group]|uniref:Uncharacterized protein n=1 Tax=Oryza sativa subsp. indica TaxID=39946 RepID=B8AQ76_ORYSI|nr:hypothetical protein OsI_11728 [Oryza sativa Indica Group]
MEAEGGDGAGEMEAKGGGRWPGRRRRRGAMEAEVEAPRDGWGCGGWRAEDGGGGAARWRRRQQRGAMEEEAEAEAARDGWGCGGRRDEDGWGCGLERVTSKPLARPRHPVSWQRWNTCGGYPMGGARWCPQLVRALAELREEESFGRDVSHCNVARRSSVGV